MPIVVKGITQGGCIRFGAWGCFAFGEDTKDIITTNLEKLLEARSSSFDSDDPLRPPATRTCKFIGLYHPSRPPAQRLQGWSISPETYKATRGEPFEAMIEESKEELEIEEGKKFDK
ncbi:hypothetical protein Sjap_011298 [Stephania japonica]|uniref:Uncharacterized protein n=1 Tax=Stephania japonica TaxID=461633 RepID=A0AAP0P7Z5_9MAGN